MNAPVLIGTAGGSGSGKSTVVGRILDVLGPGRVGIVHADAYYRDYGHLSPDERSLVNFDHPDALDLPLLLAHVDALREGHGVDVPIYDFATHTRTGATRRIEPTPVVIVDGILVLAEPELRRRLDIKIFVDTDADVRFIRRLERDVAERGRTVESVIRQYLDTVRPMHLEFVEPSKRWADVIIPTGGENEVAIEMVVARLRWLLERRE
ncbi:MAG: uridine kinase [Gemmatimonadetes bacterium]|nr:uridine kinase [Gemmatimonadota bacterium]